MANEAFHELLYEWDFDDPTSGTWRTTGHLRNEDKGPLAIHVFENPGTYAVQLTVRSGSEVAAATRRIYVDDPNDVWSGPNTRCVSTSGNFSGCPSGAERITSNDFDSGVNEALSAGKKRILFRGGETFFQNAKANISLDGPGLIGSYGTGRAIVDARKCTGYLLGSTSGGQTTDWRIENLEILQVPEGGENPDDGGNSVFQADATDSFDSFLLNNIKRVAGDDLLHSERAASYGMAGAIGVFVVDSELDNTQVNATNTLHIATRQGGIIGNIINANDVNDGLGCNDGHVGAQHPIRIGSPGRWEDFILAHNDFKRGGCSDISIRGEHRDHDTPSQFAVVRDNIMRPGSGIAFGIWPQTSVLPGGDQRIADVIVENNWIGIQHNIVVNRSTVRNNFFTGPLDVSTNHGCAIPPGWFDHIRILNNSFVGTSGFVRVRAGSECPENMPDHHVVKNNVAWGSKVYTNDAGIDGGSVSNNFDADDMPSTPFAVASPSLGDVDDWRLTGPSAYIVKGAGVNLGSEVKLDFEDNERPASGSYDIGALEDGESPPPAAAAPAPELAAPLLLD